MAQPKTTKIAILPRFTTIVGGTPTGTTVYTPPVNVEAIARANLTMWVGTIFGTTPQVVLSVEESADLTEWSALGGGSFISPGQETDSVEFGQQWMRLAITVTGTNSAVMCWVVGEFTPRYQ